MKFEEIVILYRKNNGLRSLDEMAEKLNLSKTGLIAIRNGKGGLKDTTIQKLMEGTGLEAWEIEAAWKAEHGRTEAIRRSWRRFLKKSAVAGLACCAIAGQKPVNASIQVMNEGHVYYVKLRKRLYRLRNCKRNKTLREFFGV